MEGGEELDTEGAGERRGVEEGKPRGGKCHQPMYILLPQKVERISFECAPTSTRTDFNAHRLQRAPARWDLLVEWSSSSRLKGWVGFAKCVNFDLPPLEEGRPPERYTRS